MGKYLPTAYRPAGRYYVARSNDQPVLESTEYSFACALACWVLVLVLNE
jgi:hypothetical protein